ncbi:hypothetical protein KZJ38_07360 [Paraburkholderia edwinii]|uniref:DUF8033 domain-containing protein n=1 Tax=Paraburkholderia edwinii TaxID=2861782 RepID=A0ABX8UTA9_9BURK|nr:hypothetical protein [Paraburkholderia edwinii]QYD70118.1 hypothetical protein KZJ38_07360 [Paraburkholderia edwinii]
MLEFKSGTRILFSYESPVAVFVPNEGYEQTNQFISRTTLKHIQKWVGKEPCRIVSQEAIARRFNDQIGKHTPEEDDDSGR